MKRKILLCFVICSYFGQIFTQKTDNNETIRRIGLKESNVMEIAFNLCEVYGPRLTGSAKLNNAQDWAVAELKSWGLVNVAKEEWGTFGRGWQLEHFEMHAYSPDYWQVIAYPKAWSPSTNGLVTGEIIYLQANSSQELEKYKGNLKGKMVMLDTIRDVNEWFDAPAKRYISDDLLQMANAPLPSPRPRRNWATGPGQSFNKELWTLLDKEQPLCIIDRNFKGDLGTVFVTGARVGGQEDKKAQDEGVRIIPQVTMAVEHYNRILRLISKGHSPKLSINIKSRYENPNNGIVHNIIAEIPGTDLKDEVVMFGAHMDSWHTGTGATDNGAGSSVMMEVARILSKYIKESGEKPRRTLRLALWSGEEQGLLGSVNYVRKHFAETEPGGWIPKVLKPEQQKVSAYYNLDNGTGKIRGIYTQGNEEVIPIFREWLDAFKDLGANTITIENTGGTDHQAFDGVGIPGFQFIQEPIAYSNRTHHSNMDNWDHLVADDLMQAATVIASIVWQTSQKDKKMPRKPSNIDPPVKSKP
ncbi:MAG: M28 family peptidase [Saprospiraceae bacterium]|jgi:hypothetical protein|nr:M28 family peptidase [Saprospiraceae bacterium]